MNEATEQWLAFARQDLRLPEGFPGRRDAQEALDVAKQTLERVEGVL